MTRLTLLTVVLIISVRLSSVKHITTDKGVSRTTNSSITEETEEQTYAYENGNGSAYQGKPGLNATVGPEIYESNCSDHKDQDEATSESYYTTSLLLNSSTPLVNTTSDRLKQSIWSSANLSTEADHYSTTQENISAMSTGSMQNSENNSLQNNSLQNNSLQNNSLQNNSLQNNSLHLHVQHLEASNIMVYSDKTNFSHLQDKHNEVDPRKTFVKRSGKEEQKPQTNTTSNASQKNYEAKEGITHQERIQILNGHNDIIANLEVTASNMGFMVHNLQVEKVALLWAKQCDSKAGFPTLDFTGFMFNEGDFGHNSLMNETYSWDLVLAKWKTGREEFDIMNSQCMVNSKFCAHYVRLVWADTIYMGCSVAFCPVYFNDYERLENMFNYACYYTPSGNTRPFGILRMLSPPYIRGPPGTKCPPSRPHVWGNFCRTDPPCKEVVECKYPRDINLCLCDESVYSSGHRSIILHCTLLGLAFLFVMAQAHMHTVESILKK